MKNWMILPLLFLSSCVFSQTISNVTITKVQEIPQKVQNNNQSSDNYITLNVTKTPDKYFKISVVYTIKSVTQAQANKISKDTTLKVLKYNKMEQILLVEWNSPHPEKMESSLLYSADSAGMYQAVQDTINKHWKQAMLKKLK